MLGVLPGALLLAACQPAERDQIWEGEHLLVTSKEGVELCGGSIAFLEAYAVHISNYWATTDPPAPLELELRQSGDEFLGGASYDRSAWAGSEISVLHEINHMITRSHDGASAPSLAEGIATAIAPRDPASMWGPAYGAPEDFAFLERGEFDSSDYEPAAQLSRFLIQRYGVETYRRVYSEARPDDSSETIEGAFLSVFGDEIYDAFDEFEAGPQCGLRAWECESTLHPMLTLPVELHSPDDCTKDPDWVGADPSAGDDWYPHRRFLLQVDEDTPVITIGQNARLARSICDDVCPSPGSPPAFENMAALAPSGVAPVRVLTAGLHTFHLLPLDPNEPFSVRVERAP